VDGVANAAPATNTNTIPRDFRIINPPSGVMLEYPIVVLP
jgi:hypothetical protein